MSLSPHTCHLCLVLHPPSPHNQAVWGYAQRVGHPNGTPPKPSWRAAHSKTLLIVISANDVPPPPPTSSQRGPPLIPH